MSLVFEEHRLDDVAARPELDPGALLRRTASVAARARSARSVALEAGLATLAEQGRPRAVVVVGTGEAALAGELLAAVCAGSSPVPVSVVSGSHLPGWVGANDLVMAAAALPGREADDIAQLAMEAVRRGCRFFAVGSSDGPLAAVAEQARAPYAAVTAEPGAALWPIAIPLLTAATEVGVAALPTDVYEAAAAKLEEAAWINGPSVETFENPAKTLAYDLAGTLPVVWGAGPVAGFAARWFVAKLAANAGYPAAAGEFPGAGAEQLTLLRGPFGGTGPRSIFDDPIEDDVTRLRAVLLSDTADPHGAEGSVAEREMAAAVELARARGVAISELGTETGRVVERMAGLLALTEYVTVYLAVAYGLDPSTNTLVAG
ncbi:SIS domain-containing protein [Salinactinospora qingdaonensis]|uniref:SIS domain-containing protein n=1 Tax=Salinactinospora qingdaonensis TaxID=702744 RepID=A0ABP7FXL6_9ACTN